MKTMLAMMLLMGLLVWAVGCDSKADELEKQHHLYNIGTCTVETNKADASLKGLDVWDKATPEAKQRQHDYRAAECMGQLEHTTTEFQENKHDFYGKVEI